MTHLLRTLHLLIASLLLLPLFSQPVIQSFTGGNPGDILTLIECDTNGVIQGAPGASITWDYSSLLPTATRYEMVIDAETAPFYSNFSGTNYCRNVYPPPEFFSFYICTPYELVNMGFSTWYSSITYDDGIKLMEYPFTYNDSFLDTVCVMFENSIETSYYTRSADAYGSLILPNGTYDEVLRVKCTGVSIDSNLNTGVINTSQFLEFKYFKDNVFGPLMIYSERFNDSTDIFKFIFYNLNPMVDIQENHVQGPEIFPNPAKKYIYIKFLDPSDTETQIKVFNMSGVELISYVAKNTNLLKVNLSGLSPGIYLLRGMHGDKTFSEKIIKGY